MQERFRLRKSSEFKLVRGEGRSWAHPLLVMYARPNQLPSSRVGIVVTKRVGNAVRRNRVKRRVREAVRLRWTEIASGFDLVLIARMPAGSADFAAIGSVIEQLARRGGLWKEAGPARLKGVEPEGRQ